MHSISMSPNKSVRFEPAIMAVIKLFHADQKYFRMMGFDADPQQTNQTCKFNRRNLFFILTLAGMFVPIVGSVIFEENSVAEYSAACYELITIMALLTYFAVIFYHMGNIQTLIREFEKFIENRKLITFCYSNLKK